MKEISINQLAKMVCDLPAKEKILVRQKSANELLGITCSDIFGSDLIIVYQIGSGFAAIFDTSTNNEEVEMCTWLQNIFQCSDYDKTVYLLDKEEVFPELQSMNELWGVTFKVSQPNCHPFRTLSISECALFSSREEAEAWIDIYRGMSHDSAFYSEDCSEPKAVLIDSWQRSNKDKTFNNVVPNFTGRINNLREDIIGSIISILKENELSEILLDGMIEEPTYVLWFGGKSWYDSPVTAVSLTDKGISLEVEDQFENVSTTLYSNDADLAFKNLSWLESIRGDVLEAIKVTKAMKKDIQHSS
ncbi:hypothetical protein DW228_06325 [Bacteroides fragilis]|uniref:Uncharacterized protein n=1 Tax=Bacteroides fragilis TaxID=817 RepID=A0A396C5Q2_BACFG|nr:hypothetical protein [Bacteroides fragilis]RHH14413.1 hypothetical protein DW228_06325 [Bacteroides fragilis]